MAADHEHNIRRDRHELVPEILAGGLRTHLVTGVVRVLRRAVLEIAVGHRYDLMTDVLLASGKGPDPLQDLRPRGELGGYDQDVTPVPVVELKRGVLHRDVAVAVREIRHEAVPPAGVALEGEIFRELCPAVLGCLIAIVMVAARDDVRDLAVKTRHGPRRGLPHLAAGLVHHLAVHLDVLVLLDQISGAEHGLDVQVIHIVGDPGGAQLKDRLVDVVLVVGLGIAKDDHGERILVLKILTVSPVLGKKRIRSDREQT